MITYKANKPIVTYILVAINILVFVLLMGYHLYSGVRYEELLLQYGAKVSRNILEGEYWRFVTPIFLHGSMTHLVVNAYSLYVIGSLVERIYGHSKFIISYLIAGIVGTIMSFLFVEGYSVGASGAIFGLMGMLLYFGIEYPLQFKTYFSRSIIGTLLLNLAYGFSVTGIDNCAHLGGLLGGFLTIGALTAPRRNVWYCKRFPYIVALCVIIIGSLTYGFNNKQSKITRQVAQLEQLEIEQNWPKLEACAKETLELEPARKSDQVAILWSLAKSQLIQNESKEAISYAERLAKISPENGYYLLSIAYYNEGLYSEALVSLKKAQGAGNDSEQVSSLIEELTEYTRMFTNKEEGQ